MVSIPPAPVLSENLQRFATFSNFPSWSPVYSSKLSSAGFSYVGKSDIVKCTSCDLEIGDWNNQKLSPILLHLQNEPSCPLAKELRKLVSEMDPKFEAENESCTGKQRFFETSQKTNQPASKQSTDTIILETTKFQERRLNESPDNSMVLLDGGYSTSQASSKSFIPNVPPKYQNHTLLFQRVETFDRWPRDHPISPEDLARAGFFFTGTNDLVRCFNCGGGLTSWETEDSPWIEHARWFPKCTFLRQNKGDEFIHVVQEMHSPNESNASETNTAHACSNHSDDANIEQLVCVKSVRDLGYSMDMIKIAYEDAIRKFETNDISAVQLMGQVFEIEENNPSGATGFGAPQSTTSENLYVSTQESKVESGRLSANQPCEQIRRTTSDHKGATSTNDVNKDTLLCKVCFEEQVCVAFLPCGHLTTCGQCAPAMRKCPICRELVKGSVKIYL